MKHLIVIVFIILIVSCSSSKQIIDTSSKTETTVEMKTETENVSPKDSIKQYNIKESVIVIVKDIVEEKDKVKQQDNTIKLPPNPPKQKENYTFNHNRWNTFLKQYVSNNGNVNYQAIKNNRSELDIYIDSLSENLPDNTWTKQEILAYWINAYNALTVDLIVRNYPLQSIKDIKEPWEQRLWKLGSKWYNLDEIEHQILRKMNEPRIHFTIVCASFSCPKLLNKAFTAAFLESQLTTATKEFLSDKNRNEISQNSLRLSKIFKWFKKDFEDNGSLIDFLNIYSEIKISEKAKKSYLDYNWDLND